VKYGPLDASSSSRDLASDADAELIGEEPSNYTGRVVRGGLDIDGDGIGDLIAPAPYASVAGPPTSGAVYVVYGPPAGDIDLGSADGRLLGEGAGDYAGWADALGDVNGDGLADVIVGSDNSSGGRTAGAAYVVFGPASGDVDLGSADIIIRGDTTGQEAGSGVAAGDVDGDGAADVLVGGTGDGSGAGAAWLFFSPAAGTYSVADADAVFHGETGSGAGQGVALGDLNGDGTADVVVGAPTENTGGPSAGAAYVMYARF
jgi:hypothetical protein